MRIGAAIVRRRRGVLAVVAILAIIAAAGMPRLEADFTVDELFADAGDMRRITTEAREHFGNTDNTLLVVIERAEGGRWSEGLASIAAITAAVRATAGVASVASITSIRLNSDAGILPPLESAAGLDEAQAGRRIRAALETPLVRGRLLAADESVAVVVAQLASELETADDLSRVIDAVRAGIAPIAAGSADRITLGGLPTIRVEVIDAMNRDQMRLLPIGFAICLLVLFVAFRWWPALLLPLVAVGLSALISVGAMAWSGTPMTVVTNIVPLLIVIIGVSDSIHLISRHLEERGGGSSALESAAIATDRVFIACLLTSVTTAIGFASLSGSSIGVLRVFGIVAASGVLIAFVITMTFLPATLASVRAPDRGGRGLAHHLSLVKLTRPLIAHRWLVIAVFAVLTAGAGSLLRYLEVDEGVRRQFDEDTSIGKTMTVLEEHLEGLRPLDLLLDSERAGRFKEPEVVAALDSIGLWAAAQPETLAARGLGDVLREVRFALSGGERPRAEPITAGDDTATLALLGRAAANAPDLVTSDYRHVRIAISLADLGSKVTLEFAGRLRERASAAFAAYPDIKIAIGGEGYASSLGLESLIRDLARSLAIAVLGIFLVLGLVFRSPRWALIGLIPSGLPIVFGLAYMTARGIPLGTATVIVFSVALGLAVDGTIHVLARYREELAAGQKDALVEAIDGSGRAIIATCLTLVVGFGVLSLSSFIPVRQFGELIAVSIAGSLLCQLILLPPLLSAAGGRPAS